MWTNANALEATGRMGLVLQGTSDSTVSAVVPPDDLLRVWWAVSGMLVLLMQVGFIHLEMGSVRRHNRTGIAVKNFVLLLVSTLCYGLVGFRLMYGESYQGLVGNPLELTAAAAQGPEWMFLQLGFASVAATIISGALAGRSSLLSNAFLAAVVATVLYPLFGHWMWNEGGWLNALGAHDFAGSGVVHLVGGTAALVCAWVLGARREIVNDDGSLKSHVGPRSVQFVTTGVVFLWIGWIGFNGGSVTMAHLAAGEPGYPLIGHAIMATCIAAGAGGLAALVVAVFHRRMFGPGRALELEDFLSQNMGFDPYATLSGAMGGMVAVTANCDWVVGALWAAALIGVAGGVISFATSLWVKRRVDDPVDAVAVHAGAGGFGLLLASFHTDSGFVIQLGALASGLALTLAVILPAARFVTWLEVFRVSAEDEEDGLSWEPPEKAVVPYRPPQVREPGAAALGPRVQS